LYTGKKIGEEKTANGGQGVGQAGNQEGEEIYETEITIEELINYLFDDLNLPDIDKKRIAEQESIRSYKTPRLAKKRSVIEKIKRKQAYLRNSRELGDLDESAEEDIAAQETLDGVRKRFPFSEDDLRYRRVREDRKKDFNAVVICIMDVSGSMDQTKKYLFCCTSL